MKNIGCPEGSPEVPCLRSSADISLLPYTVLKYTLYLTVIDILIRCLKRPREDTGQEESVLQNPEHTTMYLKANLKLLSDTLA